MKRSLSAVLLLSLAACSNAPDAGSTCTGKCDSFGIEQVAFTCDNASDGTVECVRALPADFPLSVDITLATLENAPGTVHAATLDGTTTFRAAPGTRVLAMVSLGATPPQYGLFHATGDSDALDSFNREVKLPAGKSSYVLPFDIWRLQLEGDALMLNGELSSQTFDITPWETFLHKANRVTRTAAPLPVYEKTPMSIFVLVARGTTSITGGAQFCDDTGCDTTAFSLDGSGTYQVTRSGLSRPGEPPVDEPQPAPDLGSGSTPDLVSSEPQPPADPTPGCGGEGELRCNDNGEYFCDDHFVYSNGHCTACGRDAQPRCNHNGDYLCDDHFVYSNGLCRACGAEGQPRCYVNGDYVCDDHFVYTNGLCTACGRDLQPRCYVNGDYVCDDHFVYANALCRACGRDQQPRCYVNGDYVCDDGFTYSSGLCHTP